MKYNIIVATEKNNGIGNKNKLPWNYIKNDMKLFSQLTKGENLNNAIIMGKKTFLSIGKELEGRKNLIISTSLTLNYLDINNIKYNPDNSKIFSNINNCIQFCNSQNFDSVWIIGGEEIYNQFLSLNIIDNIYQCKIYNSYKCDKFFPEIPLKYSLNSIQKINDDPCVFQLIWGKLMP